jgi:hypothetical protein
MQNVTHVEDFGVVVANLASFPVKESCIAGMVEVQIK